MGYIEDHHEDEMYDLYMDSQSKKNKTMAKTRTNLYNGDFTKYFDKNQKRNIWVLGYFGNNLSEAIQVAKDYAKATGVPLNTVCMDEILSSRRFKSFKYVYSQTEQKPENGAEQMDNVHQWLRD